jgi:hypothetical protein
MAPLTQAEAAAADRAAAAAAAAGFGGGGGGSDSDEDAGSTPALLLPTPAQSLRASVAVMLRALDDAPARAAEEEKAQRPRETEAAAARALHAADALAFARKLAAYATPWARDAGERLALGLARWCPAAREELLLLAAAGGGGSGGEGEGASPSGAPGDARAGAVAMFGGALVSRAPFGSELFRRGVVAACMSLDGCTGDDFARFCGARPYEGGGSGAAAPPVGAASWAPCPLARLHARLSSASPTVKGQAGDELEACRDAFLLCLGRARRSAAAAAAAAGRGAAAGSLAPPAPSSGAVLPSEGYWAGVAGLERLEAALAGRAGVRPPQQQQKEAKAAAAKVVVAPPPPAAAAASSPPASVQAARAAWAARPLRDPLPDAVLAAKKAAAAAAVAKASPSAPPALPPRLSWRQTSADVEVRLALPLGTTARDVRVDVAAARLSVRLSWLPAEGAPVLEGELYRRVKAGETVWTVASCGGGGGGGGGRGGGQEAAAGASVGDGSEAAELQLLLPKDEARRYWKGLFAGEEERGHLELLREAVDAEETRADAAALDAAAAVERGGGGGDGDRGGGGGGGAAELVRQLRERQELVASGALDLEHGFDDFRLVLSDDGL